jgi:ribosomal-protein-alanine N-acetyltransferase
MNLIPVENTIDHFRTCKVWLEDKDITKWLSSVLRFGRYFKITHEMLISNKKNRLFFISFDGRLIGLLGFNSIDQMDKRAEVWYLIGSKSDRGKNIATNAVALAKKIAAQELGLISLYAYVSEPNAISIRVLEKNGFQYAGKFRKAFLLDGEYTDLLIFDWICNQL